MSQTVGELLASTLAQLGVTQVFGIVGDALNPFTDAIRREKRLSWLGVRHEEGAALAAAGQAKLTGRLGVCAGTTGPGATHLIAGLYEASHDHAPVLAIAGDVPTRMGGIDYVQAADHVQSFRDACVYAASVNSPDAAAGQIHEAIAAAFGSRGVALLNIPQDVFAAKTSIAVGSLATLRPRPEISPADADLDSAAQMIDRAKSVVLFVGYGAHSAKAEVAALARKLAAPIVHTYRALDLYPFDDPYVIGGLGLIGSKAGYDAIHDCELLLMIGSDYPYKEFLPQKAQVVQIDERAFAIGRRLPVAQALDRHRQVIVLCGDGGFAMLMQEFFTSVQHDLPVKVFVFNNGGWGLVHLEMEEAGLPVFSGAKTGNPDFAMFAQSCGARGYRVTDPQQLGDIIATALAAPGPALVDVLVDPTEIPAMPHVKIEQVWKFGIGKIRELVGQ